MYKFARNIIIWRLVVIFFCPAPKGHEKIMEQGAVEGLELAEEVMMAMAEHAEK